MHRAARLALPLALACAALAPAQSSFFQVASPNPIALSDQLDGLGIDVAGTSRTPGTVGVIGDSSTLSVLAGLGLAPVLVRGPGSFFDFAPALQTNEDIPAGYLTPAQITAQMQAWAASYPSICALHNLAAEYGFPGGTYGGRPITGLKISTNPAVNQDKPNVLIVACHHARELNSVEVVLDQINRILTGYGTNATITAWVNAYEIWMVPIWNADGHSYVWTNNANWRKNRHSFGSTTGVDLNRNYPLGWNGPCAGDTSPSSDTYRGPSVASEIETQVMLNFGLDRQFAKVLDFHSYGREVLYTYKCLTFPAALENWYVAEATALSYACNYGGVIRKTSADGEHQQHQLHRFGSFSFLIEIGTQFQPSYTETTTEKTNTWGGVTWFLNHDIAVKGHTRDACTGLPVQADRTVSGIAYSQGEIRRSEFRFGRYHEFLPQGQWTITFSAAGYASEVRTVNVAPGAPVSLDVNLWPVMTLNAPATAPVGSTINLSFSSPLDPFAMYVVGTSITGTSPGFDLAGCHIPINYDTITDLAVNNLPPFSNFVGALSATGTGAAQVFLPSDPGIAGYAADFALVTVPSQAPLLLRAMQQPVHLLIVP